MKSMRHDHLNATTTEVVARLQGTWHADVEAYDAVQQEILRMADTLTEGIVKQFPKQF